MARLPANADVFNAIAEPQRRAILELLAQEERSVSEIARTLNLNQPQTSKHLRVLREVDLVGVRNEGKKRLYRLRGEALKPIYDWVSPFEQSWRERFDRLDEYLQSLQEEQTNEQGKSAE